MSAGPAACALQPAVESHGVMPCPSWKPLQGLEEAQKSRASCDPESRESGSRGREGDNRKEAGGCGVWLSCQLSTVSLMRAPTTIPGGIVRFIMFKKRRKGNVF